MSSEAFLRSVREAISEPIPLPGMGSTALRHTRLLEVGRRNLSLARLVEAHFDAVAILAEAGREAKAGALYGVWASEKPGQALQFGSTGSTLSVTGRKMFCSGGGLVDRALVTAGAPEPQLIDLDLRGNATAIYYDNSDWKTEAFRETQTATATFSDASFTPNDFVAGPAWYLDRPGFWHGACGPAACWAGGAAGLLDYALSQSRDDAHTLAHLGALYASVWALRAYLDVAGREIDAAPNDSKAARVRARTVRHLVEQASTEMLRRLPRAYGPYPLAMDEDVAERYHELDLYLRQSHAERDLEALGKDVREMERHQTVLTGQQR